MFAATIPAVDASPTYTLSSSGKTVTLTKGTVFYVKLAGSYRDPWKANLSGRLKITNKQIVKQKTGVYVYTWTINPVARGTASLIIKRSTGKIFTLNFKIV